MGLYRDALLASGLAVVNGLVGVFQETRAKRRLDQIALLNRSQANVVRDGVERPLDPDQIVRGDIAASSALGTRFLPTARSSGRARWRWTSRC